MMRIPILLTFLPQILTSAALGVTIIVLFAQMHERSITKTMEIGVGDSLRFVEQRLAAPFSRMRADTFVLYELIKMHDAYAWREDKPGGWIYNDPSYLRPFFEAGYAMMNHSNGSYPYIYQLNRMRYPYNRSTYGTEHDNQKFPWSSVVLAPTYSHQIIDEQNAYVFNEEIWNTYPFVNTTIDHLLDTYDERQYAYAQFISHLTNSSEDREGRWGPVELYVDSLQDLKPFVLYTFSIPITWDPVTGMATSAISIDMDCAVWLVEYVQNLKVVATEFTIIDPVSLQVLTSSFPSLAFGYDRPNASDIDSFRLWNATGSPEPRLTEAMRAIAAATNGAPWTALPDDEVITTPKGSDYIYSARPVREADLNLVLVGVTAKSHYFTEGDAAQRDTIIIAVVLLLVMLAIAIATAKLLQRPLQQLGRRMKDTASFKSDRSQDPISVVSELAEMQESYLAMKAELQRVKPFLPQGIVIRDEETFHNVLESRNGTPFSSAKDLSSRSPQLSPRGGRSPRRSMSPAQQSRASRSIDEQSRNTVTIDVAEEHEIPRSETPCVPSHDGSEMFMQDPNMAYVPEFSVDECNSSDEGSFGVGFELLREETNVVKARDCVVAVVSAAFPMDLDMKEGRDAMEKLFRIVFGAAGNCNGVIESVSPYQVVVTFNARAFVSSPAIDALSMGLRIAHGARSATEFAVSTVIDVQRAFVGSLGTERFRQNIVFSEDLEGLKTLAMGSLEVHREVSVLGTERVSPSFENAAHLLPIDALRWCGGSSGGCKMMLYAVFPRTQKTAAATDVPLLELHEAISAVSSRNYDGARRCLQEAASADNSDDTLRDFVKRSCTALGVWVDECHSTSSDCREYRGWASKPQSRFVPEYSDSVTPQ